MAIDLFRTIHGIDIQSDDLSQNSNILIGSGLPGGDGGDQDAAPIGSTFHRTDAETDGLQFYWKHANTNNSSADWKVSVDKAYVDAIVSGLSWREAAVVLDSTTYVDSTEFPTTGTVDGVPLADGARVLFTGVGTAGDNNVFIWDATNSSWTEDTNKETDGDAILINEGTSASSQYIYDGTNWVLFGSNTTTDEIGFNRTFMGKTGPGSEFPTYSSTNVVTAAVNLETAIGEIDTNIGSGVITNKAPDKSLQGDLENVAGGTLSITDALTALNDGIGASTFTNPGQNITNGDPVNTNIDKLNDAVLGLQRNQAKPSGTQVAGVATIADIFPIYEISEIKWLVQVRETATPTNRRSFEIHAITDGTNIDFTTYAVLTLGLPIVGFSADVKKSGSNLALELNSVSGVDYVVSRVNYSSF